MKQNNIFTNLLQLENNDEKPLHTLKEICDWIEQRRKNLKVNIAQISLEECSPWYYDSSQGCIKNPEENFFQIYGLQQINKNEIKFEQPIILQQEIGFLGIIACKINGILHFLMQAKIEPGNLEHVQIAPTLQATKSNFMQKHGGNRPMYLDYFINAESKNVIVDQLQSEHSSKFFKKRNRNIIISVEKMIPETETHKWMTLNQIKQLMRIDNLINMDTRTVISCIPCKNDNINSQNFVDIYHHVNNYKMFNENKTKLVSLSNLKYWQMKNNELVCQKESPLKVIFCDVEIEKREVSKWKQPMLSVSKSGLYGLFCCKDDGIVKFLVKICPEPGCFDSVEIGPTIQEEHSFEKSPNRIDEIFYQKLKNKDNIVSDCILSEEGGRFYHYQNRYVIICVDKEEIGNVPKNFVWSDYCTLNILTKINNCLNIQLRNLLSLL